VAGERIDRAVFGVHGVADTAEEYAVIVREFLRFLSAFIDFQNFTRCGIERCYRRIDARGEVQNVTDHRASVLQLDGHAFDVA
jgi:hypothetical protein